LHHAIIVKAQISAIVQLNICSVHHEWRTSLPSNEKHALTDIAIFTNRVVPRYTTRKELPSGYGDTSIRRDAGRGFMIANQLVKHLPMLCTGASECLTTPRNQ